MIFSRTLANGARSGVLNHASASWPDPWLGIWNLLERGLPVPIRRLEYRNSRPGSLFQGNGTWRRTWLDLPVEAPPIRARVRAGVCMQNRDPRHPARTPRDFREILRVEIRNGGRGGRVQAEDPVGAIARLRFSGRRRTRRSGSRTGRSSAPTGASSACTTLEMGSPGKSRAGAGEFIVGARAGGVNAMVAACSISGTMPRRSRRRSTNG